MILVVVFEQIYIFDDKLNQKQLQKRWVFIILNIIWAFGGKMSSLTFLFTLQ